jgi:hypothetical protein
MTVKDGVVHPDLHTPRVPRCGSGVVVIAILCQHFSATPNQSSKLMRDKKDLPLSLPLFLISELQVAMLVTQGSFVVQPPLQDHHPLWLCPVTEGELHLK